MTFKLGRIFYVILILFTFLWNQQTPFFTQKIAIENSYREKVVSAISRLLGRENFIVIITVEFSNTGGALNNSATLQSAPSSQNGYTPIPGLPTVPSRDGSLPNTRAGRGRSAGENNYSISKITVNIELDEELAIGAIIEEIETLVEKAIPEIKGCEDCIKIGTIQFLPSEKSTLQKQLDELQETVSTLQSANELLEDEKRKNDLEVEEKRYAEVQKKLSEALQLEEKKYAEVQKQLDALEKRELEREEDEREAKELELKILQEEKKLRNDQIIKDKEASERKVERMLNSKIKSDSLIISEAMDMYRSVMKQKGGGDYDNEALLGMQIGNSSPGILNAIIFLLFIIFIIILLFIALNKKNKPIYLKPKAKKKSDKNSAIDDEIDNKTSEPVLKDDEESIRSELRSLRQTAVSLTVGEKESASALIKEWLEDNPNKEENPVE